MSDEVSVLIATIPSRHPSLHDVVWALAPQASRVCVSLNGFQRYPDWLDAFPTVQHIVHPTDERRANAVWEWMSLVRGYVVIADDDIAYPTRYIEHMTSTVERYNRKVVITVHGKWFNGGRLGLTHFAHRLFMDRRVEIAGVGTCCFHTDLLRPDPSAFPNPYFRDLQFSLLCKRMGIPIYAIQRMDDWLRPIPTKGLTLCDKTQQDDLLRTQGIELMEGIRNGK